MFSFFRQTDRWRWDAKKGVPDKKVLKSQRQALRSGRADVKVRVLEHLVELAEASDEIKGALFHGKVTAEVCHVFLKDASQVQEAAADALASLCHLHPDNCAAVAATRSTIPRALSLAASPSASPRLATAATYFLDELASTYPASILPLLLAPGGLTTLISAARAAHAASLSPSTPAPHCAALLAWLDAFLGLLLTVCAGGGPPACREVGKAAGLRLLLDLVQGHRGQAPAGEGGGGHVGVVRRALRLLALIMSQVPAHRLPLGEAAADGVRRLLAALKDGSLPWSARRHAVAAAAAACASATVGAEFVAAGGLEVAVRLLGAYGSAKEEERAGSPAPGTAGRASPARSPLSTPARASPAPSPLSPAPLGWDDEDEDGAEPGPHAVAEALLGLVDAVAAGRDPGLAGVAAEGPRRGLLLRVLRAGLGEGFRQGGYRVATAVAQVLFHLSRQPAVLPALAGPDVAAPLAGLLERGAEHTPVRDARQAQVVHGAWCAAGLLCQVLDREVREGGTASAAAHSPLLRGAVRLAEASGQALLAAAGCAPGPGPGGMRTPGEEQPAAALAGVAYLQSERVLADLRSAAGSLLALLVELAGDVRARGALGDMDVAGAVRQLLPWRELQWPAKRLLHLLGEREVEYQPFVRYGWPLLRALLAGQGLDPAPFAARGVDAHILLGLEDGYLREALRLDAVQVIKVGRIRAAHALFAAMDAADGRIDGCVAGADVEAYLTQAANMRPAAAADLRERLFRELQALPGEPLCFMQFVSCFPWLDAELEAWLPHGPQQPPAMPQGQGMQGHGGQPPAPSGGDYAPRAAKRQRVGGGAATPPRAGGPVIEVDD